MMLINDAFCRKIPGPAMIFSLSPFTRGLPVVCFMEGQPPLLIKQPESVAKSHLFCDRGVGECCATNLKIEMDQKCMFNELVLMQMQTHVVTFVHVGPIHRGQPPSVRQAWICGYFHIPGWKNESCFSLCNRCLWIRKGVFLFSYIVNCDNGGPYCPSRSVQMNNGVLSVVHTSLLAYEYREEWEEESKTQSLQRAGCGMNVLETRDAPEKPRSNSTCSTHVEQHLPPRTP